MGKGRSLIKLINFLEVGCDQALGWVFLCEDVWEFGFLDLGGL